MVVRSLLHDHGLALLLLVSSATTSSGWGALAAEEVTDSIHLGRAGTQREVLLTPAMDIQHIMDSSPNGTVFTFSPGLYRYQGMWASGKWAGLRPPANSVLQAQTRRTAVLSGAMPINRTRVLGSGLWAADVAGFADNSTWPPPLPTHPKLGSAYVCEQGWEACCFRQDLFFGDQVVRRTAFRQNLSSTAERMWWMDYDTSEALTNFDPKEGGHALEISWQSSWLRAIHGSNVTVRGLVFEKIANHAQGDPDEAHTIDDCEIRYAHGIGAAAVVVTNSHVHHCGEQGVSGYILIQNNTIEYNNFANYSIGWAAGGVKIFVDRSIVEQCEASMNLYTPHQCIVWLFG